MNVGGIAAVIFFCVPSDRKKNKDYIEEEEKKK
jgi:hypothetical protein